MNDKHLDNELADYTDRVLAGDDMVASTETQEYAHLVRQLHGIIGGDDGPRPEFRMKLESILKDELKQLSPQETTAQIQYKKRQANIQSLRRRRYQQYVGVAAAFIVVVGVAYVIGNSEGTTGTASSSPFYLFGGMFFLFVLAWVANTIWERRQK